jgi:hypothetical protein
MQCAGLVQLAKMTGFSRRFLLDARKNGWVSTSMDPDVVLKEYEAFKESGRGDPAAQYDAEGPQSGSAKSRFDLARAEEKELQVAQLRGELINREKALGTFYEATKTIREALELWPPRMASELASKLKLDDPHLVENELTMQVEALLEEISGMLEARL